MRIFTPKPFSQCATPREALDELSAPFEGYSAWEDNFEVVTPEQMPQNYRGLLVHHRHMTLVLQEYHRVPVDLYVMKAVRDEDYYSRKIFLTRRGTAPAVELGLVRLDLRTVREPARQEILQGRTPLGAVLVKHKLLMRIEPRWYLRFPRGSAMLAWMGYPKEGPFYGRIGTIYCGEQPAIELLEIATLW